MRNLQSDSMRVGEFANSRLYGTDIGPECKKCIGTTWLYLVDQSPEQARLKAYETYDHIHDLRFEILEDK